MYANDLNGSIRQVFDKVTELVIVCQFLELRYCLKIVYIET